MSGNSNPRISQPMGTLQGSANMGQPVPGMSQGKHSGGQMGQSGIGMNQNVISGLGPSGVSSGTGTMIPTPGMSQQAQSGMQPLGVNNNTAANMPLGQQTSSALQSSQSKYVLNDSDCVDRIRNNKVKKEVWEGNLSGQRQGQPVFITKLEGYRSSSASETFHWGRMSQTKVLMNCIPFLDFISLLHTCVNDLAIACFQLTGRQQCK